METRNKRSSEEIDLLYFFNPLWKGFSYVKEAATGYFRYLRHNFLIFLAVFVLVVLAAYSLRFILPRYYTTSALFITHNIPAGFYDMQIRQLQNLAGKKEVADLLAQQLHIPVEISGGIKSIGTETADHSIYMYRNDTIATAAFRVNLKVKDTSGLEQIQQGIRQYLETNEFARKRKESRKKILESLKMNLQEKSKSLDSLKEGLGAGILPGKTGQVIVLGETFVPIKVYELQTAYYKEQLEIEADLNLLENDIELVQPFKTNISKEPDFNRLFRKGILAGFILAILLTLLFGKRRES